MYFFGGECSLFGGLGCFDGNSIPFASSRFTSGGGGATIVWLSK